MKDRISAGLSIRLSCGIYIIQRWVFFVLTEGASREIANSPGNIYFCDIMSLQELIQRIHPIPPEAMSKLLDIATVVSFPKYHLLFRADKIDHHLYFIRKGIVRAFTEKDEMSITFYFGMEGDPVLSMKSYVSREKSYEDIELLEDSEFYQFDGAALEGLYNEDLHIANWGRKLAEIELVRTEERLIARQFRTAAERYAELMQETPELLRRVSLGHIASYLGITQVSLSRIRTKQ